MQRGKILSYARNAAFQLTSANWSVCAFPPNSWERVQVTNIKGTPASGRISPISCCNPLGLHGMCCWGSVHRKWCLYSLYTVYILKSRVIIYTQSDLIKSFLTEPVCATYRTVIVLCKSTALILVTLLYYTGQYIKPWSYSLPYQYAKQWN